MNPIKNPFSPGAGSPPPELVGRDPVLGQARILLGRVKQKRSEKSLLLTGLRGVGKTVLLNEIERLAKGRMTTAPLPSKPMRTSRWGRSSRRTFAACFSS
jgi:AAA ATPase domain